MNTGDIPWKGASYRDGEDLVAESGDSCRISATILLLHDSLSEFLESGSVFSNADRRDSTTAKRASRSCIRARVVM